MQNLPGYGGSATGRKGSSPLEDRYQRLEKLRFLVLQQGLLLQEEARSVASALFSQPSLIFHLGLAGA